MHYPIVLRELGCPCALAGGGSGAIIAEPDPLSRGRAPLGKKPGYSAARACWSARVSAERLSAEATAVRDAITILGWVPTP